MKVSNVAAQQLLDEFTKSKVVVTFSNKLIHQEISFPNAEAGNEVHTFSNDIRPFSITINNQFVTPKEDSDKVDPQYAPYIETLKDKAITEIENNINLRIGKWDILSYLTNLEFELKEIRNKFEMGIEESESKAGIKVINPDDPFKMGLFSIYENSNIEIETYIGDQLIPGIRYIEAPDMNYTLSRYWDIQVNVIERLIRFIEPRKKVIEITDDYVQIIKVLPPQSILQWKKSDTDLLELIVALNESGSVFYNNSTMTRKHTIEFFEELFGFSIKDAESKLSRATDRKRDPAPYLTFLRQTFENYSLKKTR